MNFNTNEIILCFHHDYIIELNKDILMKDIISEMKNIGTRRYLQSGVAIELEFRILQSHWYYINNPVGHIKLK